MSSRVWLRRAYDPPTHNDGYRVLVDRIWPRGVAKAKIAIDQWAKDLAPSDDLRKWFDHDPQRWDEFQDRYRSELDGNDLLDELVERSRTDRITLVYGAHDEEHNQAVVLQTLIDERL